MVKLPFKDKLLSINMEEWKLTIETYEISNLGNVRRLLKNGKYLYLKCSIQNIGYKYFQMTRNGKRLNFLIHHLVANEFIGERPNNFVIDHIDRNKLNNNVNNLRYITQKENMFNCDRVYTDIPQDLPNRHSVVCKIYRDNHKEELKKKKKEYYETNKEILLEKIKQKETPFIKCSKCEKERKVSYTQYNNIKRKGILNNICRKCSSVQNLQEKQ